MVKERHAAYFAMQKEMVDYRHSFKDFDAGLNLLSSAMKGSLGGAGVAIAGIQGGKGILDSTGTVKFSRIKSLTIKATTNTAKNMGVQFGNSSSSGHLEKASRVSHFHSSPDHQSKSFYYFEI